MRKNKQELKKFKFKTSVRSNYRQFDIRNTQNVFYERIQV